VLREGGAGMPEPVLRKATSSTVSLVRTDEADTTEAADTPAVGDTARLRFADADSGSFGFVEAIRVNGSVTSLLGRDVDVEVSENARDCAREKSGLRGAQREVGI
jgi:hypothetical protein